MLQGVKVAIWIWSTWNVPVWLCARACSRSLVIPWWMPQMSSYFMTLFHSSFYRSHWSHFSEKNLKILKNREKKILCFDTKGSPLWKKNQNMEKLILFKENPQFNPILGFWCRNIKFFFLIFQSFQILFWKMASMGPTKSDEWNKVMKYELIWGIHREVTRDHLHVQAQSAPPHVV